MTEIDLLVDGEPVDRVDTIRLRQSEPHPGGHRYRLILCGRALSVFDRFDIQTTAEGGLDQAAAFLAIESIAAGMPREGQIPARFILNTIDQIIRDRDRASLSGVCSVPVQ